MIVAVDDLRQCAGADVIIRNSDAALSILDIHNLSDIHELWLDHDLGENDDIRRVVRHLEQEAEAMQCPWPWEMKIRILSDNPAGRKYIRQALERYFEVVP